MRRIVKQNKNQGNRGVTLVEVMISLVILLIVFMGLIQASLLSIQSNMRNVLRDEAVRITSDRMSALRTAAFISVVSSGPTPIFKNIRSVANQEFDVTIVACDTGCGMDADHKRMTVTTTWIWQGEKFTHSIVNTRGR